MDFFVCSVAECVPKRRRTSSRGLYGTYRNDAVLLIHCLVGDEGIIGIYLHTEALAVAGNEFTHIAVGVDTEAFAVDFGSRTPE